MIDFTCEVCPDDDCVLAQKNKEISTLEQQLAEASALLDECVKFIEIDLGKIGAVPYRNRKNKLLAKIKEVLWRPCSNMVLRSK